MKQSRFLHDEELKILRVKYSGILTKEEVIGHYEELRLNRSYRRNIRVLIDCKEAIFTMKPEEVTALRKAAEKAALEYNSINEAMMVSDPYETVIVTLFEKSKIIPNYDFKVFHTEEAALAWLV